MADKTKVLLVDDELLIRSGLGILLNSSDQVEVIGQAANGQEAFEFCKKNSPDCVLMDVRMPESNGIMGTKLIHDYNPEIKILILTTFQDTEYIIQAIQAGASGYLLKDSGHEEIVEAIQLAMRGNMIFDGKLQEQIAKNSLSYEKAPFDPEEYDLKEKEIEIIQGIASGLNNQEIADQMFLSLGTIKNSVTLILQKLHLRDRTQIAIFAFEKGLK